MFTLNIAKAKKKSRLSMKSETLYLKIIIHEYDFLKKTVVIQ